MTTALDDIGQTFPAAFLDTVDEGEQGGDDAATPLDAVTPDSGAPEQSVSEQGGGELSVEALLARAEETGLYSPRELKELKAGYLRQADYTRKTQELSQAKGTIEQVAAERNWLYQEWQRLSGGQQSGEPQGELDKVLSALPVEDDDNAAGMKKFLSDFAAAIVKETKADQEQTLAPIKLQREQQQFLNEMGQHFTQMTGAYGDGVKELFPSLVEETAKYRAAGYAVTPEMVLIKNHPDKARALLLGTESKTNKARTRQAASASMEGMERVRYTRPTQAPDDIPTGSQRRVDMSSAAIATRALRRMAENRVR